MVELSQDLFFFLEGIIDRLKLKHQPQENIKHLKAAVRVNNYLKTTSEKDILFLLNYLKKTGEVAIFSLNFIFNIFSVRSFF